MPLNLPLPDWVPWWVQLVLLILAILFGFAFLMMPFAVFGLKGRLDFLEAQLDDIHAELRMVAARLPDPDRAGSLAAAREPVFEELSTRPVQQREPSPTQTLSAQAPARAQPPAEPVFQRQGFRPAPQRHDPASPMPPRFGTDPESHAPAQPRRPSRSEDWTPMRAGLSAREQGNDRPGDRLGDRSGASDWDEAPDERLLRRPLRATTLRDATRDRSEPTLRFPPR